MTILKGMTWDHSRGYDPMIATSKVFEKKHNNEISIEWDKRSLQAFADRPIEQMVEEYDLMVWYWTCIHMLVMNILLKMKGCLKKD